MSNSEAPFCHIVETRGIRPTPSDQSLRSGSTSLADTIAQLHGEFALGWSHYVTLLSIDDDAARRFYEIEAADNGWSVRELKRQLDSSLYERLALSRDKRAIRRLAREGQIVEKASDLIKDPLVLEFLGLEERHTYSERELETAIIDRLQQFLLELGKGFLFEVKAMSEPRRERIVVSKTASASYKRTEVGVIPEDGSAMSEQVPSASAPVRRRPAASFLSRLVREQPLGAVGVEPPHHRRAPADHGQATLLVRIPTLSV